MWHPSELAYCSNLHPGETLADVEANLSRFFSPVMAKRGQTQMSSGLWLSAGAASELQRPEALQHFRQCLQRNGVSLTTLNGFPYGNFHQGEVKEDVYLPDWSDPRRLIYTCQLAVILASCLPHHVTMGAISTLPLGYRQHWRDDKHLKAIEHLIWLNEELAVLKALEGRHIQVCLEMEPDCVLESTTQMIDFFGELTQANGGYPEHLGVCFDVCHQGVMYEDAYDSLRRLTEAGIYIGKIQISNAFEVDTQALLDPLSDLPDVLTLFAEARYLHQVKARHTDGRLNAMPDLSGALSALYAPGSELAETENWRVHFHVPLDMSQWIHPAMTSLHDTLESVFQFLSDYRYQIKPWLEVETYSWLVLPADLQPQNDHELIDGIVKELSWLEHRLRDRGLLRYD
ncbi:metabolite traffic protein EboE [Photobacterium galatheae]|uniref:metabolite traffic protein EboE n=1 Tax=Photobacterium galatheae TaxID=1654360 RepID=UPI000563DF43|nr:metabolite traffic protein EboE [Photobacterium galatheae]MCM0150096.1 metabolite traffic protein EboE [Photobacterium galatheae]